MVIVFHSFFVFSEATLQEIAEYLNLAPPVNPDPRLLREILVSYHERRPSQLEAINDLPLYPTEEILWDETIVPSEFYDGDSELALNTTPPPYPLVLALSLFFNSISYIMCSKRTCVCLVYII